MSHFVNCKEIIERKGRNLGRELRLLGCTCNRFTTTFGERVRVRKRETVEN